MELHASHGTQCTNNPFPLQISFISNSPYCLPNYSLKVSLENSALNQLSNDPIVDILWGEILLATQECLRFTVDIMRSETKSYHMNKLFISDKF